MEDVGAERAERGGGAAVSVLGIYTARCAGGAGEGLEAFLPSGRTTLYAYGRQALVDALRRAGVRPGDGVLLPGLICREVLASVAAVGGVSRFYAVSPDLTVTLEALEAAGAGARAVIAVNYFGFPQPLAPFRAWARAHVGVVIEDNAHGLFSAAGDRRLGLRGDFGIFSLRKTLPLPNGAALVDCRPVASNGASLAFEDPPAAAERRFRAKQALRPVFGLTGARGARAFVGAVRLLRRMRTGSPLQRPAADGETRVPAERLSRLTLGLLARCDVEAERRRRRALFSWCRDVFRHVSDVEPLFPDLAPGVVPQGFPLRCRPGAAPDDVIARWWRAGIPLQRWPDLPSAIAPTAPAHYRALLLVPFLW